MSIIQEALKKAEGSRTAQSRIEATKAVVEKVESAGIKPGRKRGRIIRLLLPVFALLVLYYSITLIPAKVEIQTSRPDAVQSLPVKPQAALPGTSPDDIAGLSPIPQLPRFTLSGIMYLEDYRLAIINNAMTIEGEKIDGALVKKINERNVILDVDGDEVVLNLK